MNFKAIFEALLFLAGEEGISIDKLQNTYHLSGNEVTKFLTQLKDEYHQNSDCGLEIVQNETTFFVKTKAELAAQIDLFLEKYMGKGLSNSELNTLAIVAFKQPIMRIQVDEIRGVNSSQILHHLESKKMIRSIKSDAPGCPKVYRTTDFFLQYFNLKDLRDLPTLKGMIKEEAEKELF